MNTLFDIFKMDRFDILKKDRKDIFHWVESVNDINAAEARVRHLSAVSGSVSGKGVKRVIILEQQSGPD